MNLHDLPATRVTRQILNRAEQAGLRPYLAGEPKARVTRVYVNADGADGMFGAIDISASGRILRAWLTPGNHGTEQFYESVAGIRDAIKGWAASRQEPPR